MEYGFQLHIAFWGFFWLYYKDFWLCPLPSPSYAFHFMPTESQNLKLFHKNTQY